MVVLERGVVVCPHECERKNDYAHAMPPTIFLASFSSKTRRIGYPGNGSKSSCR